MRRHAVTAAFALLAVAAAIVVGPGIHAEGEQQEANVLELGVGAATRDVETRGDVSENVDGYVVGGLGKADVSVRVTLPYPAGDKDRTLLRVWAYALPGVRTVVVLQAADGSERVLGRPLRWEGTTFDVTEQARLGPGVLLARADNAGSQPALFLDRVAPVTAPGSLALTAPPWSVGLLVVLVTAALLALAGRLVRHWPLPLALGATAGALWHPIAGAAFVPLGLESAATWHAATSASWFGLHDGALWGSWTGVSSLAVQLAHAFTPIVGTGSSSARAAALLTALLALAAIYALVARAAGRAAALLALGLALAAGGFRADVIAAAPVPALVLAGAVFCYALHACIARATTAATAVLGAAAALLAISEPAWGAGALAAVVVVALARAQSGSRLRLAGAGLLAAAVCLLPHLASTASQNDGRLLADVDARAIAARNAEFPPGEQGAPLPRERLAGRSGRRLTLADYLFSLHSPSQVVRGVPAGARDSLTALYPSRGVLVAIAMVAGALFVVGLPGLRLLVLIPPLVAFPTLFMADRGALDPAAAGAVMWPALLACVAILAVAIGRLARQLLRRGGRPAAPLRVLHLLPHARALGGTERTVIDLLRSPLLADVEQRVAFVQPGRVLGFPPETVLGRRAGRLLPGGSLPAIVRWRPDVVHGWLLQGNAVGALLKPVLRDVVLISSERHSHARLGGPRPLLERLVAAREDVATANSAAVQAAAVARLPQRRERFRIILPGVAARPTAASPRPTTAVMVGRAHAVKDHDTALRAWQRVVERHPTATLTVVGGGPGLAALKRATGELGLANVVRFRGDSDPAPDLAGARFFLSTSRAEGFSRAVLEALAAGLPVVSTDVGGIAELASEAVRVAPVGDDAALAAQMLAWLDDPAALASAATAAPAVARRFTPAACHAAYAELYRELHPGA